MYFIELFLGVWCELLGIIFPWWNSATSGWTGIVQKCILCIRGPDSIVRILVVSKPALAFIPDAMAGLLDYPIMGHDLEFHLCIPL